MYSIITLSIRRLRAMEQRRKHSAGVLPAPKTILARGTANDRWHFASSITVPLSQTIGIGDDMSMRPSINSFMSP